MSPQDRLRDELCILRCQQGEREALGPLVARWHGRFISYALRLAGDREAAGDAVQETWMAIIAGLVHLRDAATFKPWAYRILTCKCRDTWRKAARRRQVEAAGAANRTEDAHARQEGEGLKAVRSALGRLPADDQAILALRYQEDFGTVEIAGILGIPEGTAKSRMFHAREKLRDQLTR